MLDLQLLIDSIDRTNLIEFGSLSKDDLINQRVDTLRFSLSKFGDRTFVPTVNAEVELYDGATKIFGGVIITIKEVLDDHTILNFEVECADYTRLLDRRLVVERYTEETVNDIIADILTKYCPEFTGTNVDCDLEVASVTFNRRPVSECIQKLAQLTGFSWYVDYDKDLHFFEKNTEPAPFGITDTNGNALPDSLVITNDITQIRNRVYIRGGEAIGVTRTETFLANGDDATFRLANKFYALPVVEVNSSPVTVGIDYLDNEDDFDAFWNFNEKYVRFKNTTLPALNDVIDVTGDPLFPIIVQVEDLVSISTYGVYEFARIDKTIRSRDEAVALAIAELTAYGNGINEGSFDTYTSGLKSGQIININSTLRGVSEDFVIQRVSFRQMSPEKGIWRVQVATLRTLGIINFLIDLLKDGSRLIEEKSDEVLEQSSFAKETIKLNETASATTVHNPQNETFDLDETVTPQALDYPVEFVLGPWIPTDTRRLFLLDNSPLP